MTSLYCVSHYNVLKGRGERWSRWLQITISPMDAAKISTLFLRRRSVSFFLCLNTYNEKYVATVAQPMVYILGTGQSKDFRTYLSAPIVHHLRNKYIKRSLHSNVHSVLWSYTSVNNIDNVTIYNNSQLVVETDYLRATEC